jgi:LCP family protein required for cell wall assembly
MVLGYNPKTEKAFAISIPRDTFIGTNLTKANSADKINALYKKSPEKLMNKVSEIVGIEIKYYVTINNEALIKLVDIIGGVEFEVPIDMNYDDKSQDLHIHLKKGMQLIDGKKAEQLLRFRHNNDGTSYSIEYGDNDYGRMKTQREFIMAVISQCLEERTIDEIKEMIGLAFENIKTNIELQKVLSYLVYAYNFNTENLELLQLPGESIYTNNVWLFNYDKDETDKMINTLKSSDFL